MQEESLSKESGGVIREGRHDCACERVKEKEAVPRAWLGVLIVGACLRRGDKQAPKRPNSMVTIGQIIAHSYRKRPTTKETLCSS